MCKQGHLCQECEEQFVSDIFWCIWNILLNIFSGNFHNCHNGSLERDLLPIKKDTLSKRFSHRDDSILHACLRRGFRKAFFQITFELTIMHCLDLRPKILRFSIHIAN